jgi:hypothetical protein
MPIAVAPDDIPPDPGPGDMPGGYDRYGFRALLIAFACRNPTARSRLAAPATTPRRHDRNTRRWTFITRGSERPPTTAPGT